MSKFRCLFWKILLYDLNEDTANNIHPVRKAIPPIGVMAPKVLTPVKAMTYKLPEKKIIPMKRAHPAHVISPPCPSLSARIATKIRPRAWAI